jgi:hypothetical protein
MIDRLVRWLRYKEHAALERQAHRRLRLATDDEFDLWRRRAFELSNCPDPGDPQWCSCLGAKPIRKMADG